MAPGEPPENEAAVVCCSGCSGPADCGAADFYNKGSDYNDQGSLITDQNVTCLVLMWVVTFGKWNIRSWREFGVVW